MKKDKVYIIITTVYLTKGDKQNYGLIDRLCINP